MHHEFRVSVSDCPNACSRPQIVDLGLIGACEPRVSGGLCTECGECVEVCQEKAILLKDGMPRIDESKCVFCGQCIRLCPTGALEECRSGYRILVGGKLGRHPRLGTELPGIYTREGVFQLVDRCMYHYQRHCLKGERLGEILERTGVGDL
jgi:anaerobic sulfite reductase subunit C